MAEPIPTSDMRAGPEAASPDSVLLEGAAGESLLAGTRSEAPVVTSPAGRVPLRLLIVDDDLVDRMAVVRGLRSEGVRAEFSEAESIHSAVQRLREEPFDCVFLDFNLPDGTGLQMLREVRGTGLRIPIIMLTGQGDEQLAVELMKAGASDYLSKTLISPERLAQSLRSVLRVHRAEMKARAAEEAREAALAARSRFYAAMSHELRTPINAILGYNDLLLASVYGPLNDAQAASLERSQRAVRHLLELVNDVLDLSKLEAGKMELQMEEVSVPALIEDLFATIRPLALEHSCELGFAIEECPESIVTDPRRVRQILLNLLSNAIKYGRRKPVRVRCTGTAQGGVMVEVTDQGAGIAAEDLPRIFEEFVQLRESREGGTGLGLPISQRLAELLHGRLEAVSKVGEGSTFRLILPPAPHETPQPVAPEDLLTV